ncbi:MAG: zeta toxin family protein [Polaromonas sp.]|uniref:zeta toxin family protein n=1 Tax=Polaromonas sp. TaxID=1869339 RepID=UPI0017B5165B|nr:zeta toxin family protein [Polaromonas sp.]MBA3594847.1 zeta toxin family protein [Polaromonas sp.]
MTQPIFHLLAGPNGAGKSTLYRALLDSGIIARELEFVNADLYEKTHLQDLADLQKRSEAARDWADTRRHALLDEKAGFVSETVFSHESKLSLVSRAQSLGYHVVLYVVSVNNPQHLLARVRQRVQEGGHHVPARRILERYPRTMTNLRKAVRLADLAFVYDGAEVERGAPTLVAVCKAGQTTVLVKKLPPWAAAMLATD